MCARLLALSVPGKETNSQRPSFDEFPDKLPETSSPRQARDRRDRQDN
jgi:hypothetical protein